jgi:hypothetical protein
LNPRRIVAAIAAGDEPDVIHVAMALKRSFRSLKAITTTDRGRNNR